MRVCFLCLFMILFSGLYAGTERVTYDIMLWNSKVGKMTLTHETRNDGTEIYTLETASKARVLWMDITNTSHCEQVYKGGRLISCNYKEVENDKVKRWNNIAWDGSKYLVDGYKGKRTFTGTIGASTISAYFGGMKKNGHLYYESEADFADVDYPDAATMEFKTSDGHKSTYHYANGKVASSEFKMSIATVYMVLTK